MSNIPQLITAPDAQVFNLMGRGFAIVAGTPLTAGVWSSKDEYLLTVGNDACTFDITSEVANGLTHDLDGAFFSFEIPADRINLTITPDMRWLAAVNYNHLCELGRMATLVSGNDYLTVETGFSSGLPTDYFRLHNDGVDVFALSPGEAAKALTARLSGVTLH